jgi:catechol 2,3-dioxygenase-like lactoylglutathione lyase family enzyme
MSMQLAIIQFGTIDVEASRHFYGELLGLPKKLVDFGPGFACFDLGLGQSLLLYPATTPPHRQAYPDATGSVPIFSVTDVAGIVEKLRGAGVELIPAAWADARGLAQCPFGLFIGVRDPSGNVIELLEAKMSEP